MCGERQRQRAARHREALERTGRDEQRLSRAGGHTYSVFADRATADEVMRELAATPIVADGLKWPVQVWDDAAGAGIGTLEASDGRSCGRPPLDRRRARVAGRIRGGLAHRGDHRRPARRLAAQRRE